MILVSFIKKEDSARLNVMGHAGAKKVDGMDLVCAYVSGAVDALAFALREHVTENAPFILESGCLSVEVYSPEGVAALENFADFAEEVALENPGFVMCDWHGVFGGASGGMETLKM